MHAYFIFDGHREEQISLKCKQKNRCNNGMCYQFRLQGSVVFLLVGINLVLRREKWLNELNIAKY